MRGCSVAGCARAHHARGLCRPHWRRARRGDVRAAEPIREPGTPSYSALRRRLRATRGPAAGHPCGDCCGPARVWSYDGRDPDERTDAVRGYRYSLDLAHYRPRCRPCHRRALAGPIDVARAARLYRAGASSAGIAALLDVSPATILRALRTHDVPIRRSRTR